ncbi:SEC-C motif-containing protein [Marinobacter daqiaonensis]|uniref:SEC-C motif-containing protein n=1 Tax=Marinobacter daqiaonensis TaxID=650891 RepID=A0A1I6I6K3_9GAMM|nr:YchJ family protein [Marinobacter daqiaonensis]SFR62258.1 SEC-C motif-containing protein [Marinobacter daqiaonensis]
MNLCPCGSTLTYGECCAPLHSGQRAETPEALMRSRYTAFMQGLEEYLLATWHPDTRPSRLNLSDSPDWTGLQVLASDARGDHGTVHFRAIHRLPDGFGYLEEVSDFLREQGRWYYVSGTPKEGRLNPGRNDRCPCGSGRKFKACCLP